MVLRVVVVQLMNLQSVCPAFQSMHLDTVDGSSPDATTGVESAGRVSCRGFPAGQGPEYHLVQLLCPASHGCIPPPDLPAMETVPDPTRCGVGSVESVMCIHSPEKSIALPENKCSSGCRSTKMSGLQLCHFDLTVTVLLTVHECQVL